MEMGWLILIPALLVFGLMMDGMAAANVTDGIADLIRCVFRGWPPEDCGVALHPSLKAEDLCMPLTEAELARIHGCTDVRRAEVTVERVHGLKMYLGVADLIVRYDFEGVDAAGVPVAMQRTVFLRVKYDVHRSRFGFSSVTLREVSLWEPTAAEREKWDGQSA